MENTTPTRAVRKWARSLLDGIDRFAFREPDLDALRRGWRVGRPRRFVRTYRDCRWDSVEACASCGDRIAVGGPCAACAPVGVLGRTA